MHKFRFEIGEEVRVVDTDNIFYDDVKVTIINRDYFEVVDVEVYTVVDHRNWTCAFRSCKLYY